MGRRLNGYLRWRLFRGKKYSLAPLEAFLGWVRKIGPDQIVLTGDLTHLGLPEEFEMVRDYLVRLGPPELISLSPGNHDSYAPEPWNETYAKWGKYLGGPGPLEAIFPRVRLLGKVALVGLNTALSNLPPFAAGRLGLRQLHRLAETLARLREEGFFRVVYLHHPPVSGVVSRRKALWDQKALEAVLVKEGAELILYGHAHKAACHRLETLWGKALVFGAPALTYVGKDHLRRARFYLFRLNPRERRFSFESFAWEGRDFSPESGPF